MPRSSPKRSTRRLRRRKGTDMSTSHLTFGTKSTICLMIFTFIYAIFLISTEPMLEDETKLEKFKNEFIEKKHKLIGKVKNDISNASWLDTKIHKELIDTAIEHASEHKRNGRPRNAYEDTPHHKVASHHKESLHDDDTTGAGADRGADTGVQSHADDKIPAYVPKVYPTQVQPNESGKPTNGFVILGMHRSGTSMLAGLLVEGFGYKTGYPLIEPSFDNEKGFYELIAVVVQNDIWLKSQNGDWASNVRNFDPERAIQSTESGQVSFFRGNRALSNLNDHKNVPWLQKDPRMSITLKAWLPYLNSHPAAVFTYRHPLEVALSLSKRQTSFSVQACLRLWIVYNTRAMENSNDLCRVLSNNNAVFADPIGEVTRIANELTTKCGVPAPPRTITRKITEGFVDPDLQHNKKRMDNKNKGKKILKTIGDCIIYDYESTQISETGRSREKEMYMQAMDLYCAFESGEAYKDGYEFPVL